MASGCHWEKSAVDRLDATLVPESSNKVVAEKVSWGAEENAEVVGKFGGPCRGRTYGPLIKSSHSPQSEPTQDELSAGKTEELEK